MKITAPIKGHNDTTSVGPHTLHFKDGVAEVEHLSDGAKAWLKSHGYGIGSASPKAPEQDAPAPPDPRKVATEQVGTRIRDAAVDPKPGDFLAPTNAGQANPHGPDVVNPGVHAEQGVRPVKGGDVHVGDPEAQNAAETKHAARVLAGQSITSAEQPAGNASTEAWREFALAQGVSVEELDGKSRDELREQYGKSDQQ